MTKDGQELPPAPGSFTTPLVPSFNHRCLHAGSGGFRVHRPGRRVRGICFPCVQYFASLVPSPQILERRSSKLLPAQRLLPQCPFTRSRYEPWKVPTRPAVSRTTSASKGRVAGTAKILCRQWRRRRDSEGAGEHAPSSTPSFDINDMLCHPEIEYLQGTLGTPATDIWIGTPPLQ